MTFYPSVSKTMFIANKNGSAQAGLSDATWTTVTFSATEVNYWSSFDTSTEVFTAPQTWIYSFYACARVSNTVGNASIQLMLAKNNASPWTSPWTQLRKLWMTSSNWWDQSVQGACHVSLTQGDKIHLSIYVNGNGTITISGAVEETYFSWAFLWQ